MFGGGVVTMEPAVKHKKFCSTIIKVLSHTCKEPLFLKKQPLLQIYTHARYYNVMPIPVFPLAVVAVHLTQLLEVQMASRKLQ